MEAGMKLQILLPYRVFLEEKEVLRMVVETNQGAYGLLPNRLDCVAALKPGILTYETEEKGEVFLAIDAGILVKAGKEVFVSVRKALAGKALGQLHEAIKQDYLQVEQWEKDVRNVLVKLETGFIRQFQRIRQE